MGETGPEGDTTRGQIPWGWLLAVVLVAAGVRAAVWALSMVIGADGPSFLEVADRFSRGDLDGALRHDYHPLYPLLVAAASIFGGSPEVAGEAVSFLFGVLTPIPLFFLARRFLGDAPALAAGLLLAVHPVAARLSVDLKSDSTYTFIFVCSVLYAWVAIRSQRPSAAFLAGVIGGIAYLARPEGLAVPLVATVGMLVAVKAEWGRRLALAGMLILGTALPAAPYAAAISHQDGKLRITRKKGLVDFLGAAPRAPVERRRAMSGGGSEEVRGADEPPMRLAMIVPVGAQGTPERMLREGKDELGIFEKIALAGAAVVGQFGQTLHALLLGLLLAGVVFHGAIPRRRAQEVFQGVVILTHLAVLFLLVLGVQYLSRRHVYPLTVIALPWSAAGVWEVARWARPRLARWRFTMPISEGSRATALILGVTAVVLAPKTFYPYHLDQLDQREAGRWVRTVSGGSPEYLLTHLEKVAYYAGATQVPIQKDYRTAIDIARHFRTRYVAFYREKVNRAAPGFLDAITRDEEMVRRVSFRHVEREKWLGAYREVHLDVYEILYPPEAPPPERR